MQNTQLTSEQQAAAQRVAAIKHKAKRYARIRLVVFFVSLCVFLYSVYVIFMGLSGPQADPNSTPIILTTTQLIQAYNINQISADQEYKLKLLEVSGRVGSITTGLLGNPEVTMGDGDNPILVVCDFDGSQTNVIAALIPGEAITFQGTDAGFTGSDISLTHCSIVPNASSSTS